MRKSALNNKNLNKEDNMKTAVTISFYSQTAKGSTMFPECWHGRKHSRTTIVFSCYFSINRTLFYWQFHTSTIVYN